MNEVRGTDPQILKLLHEIGEEYYSVDHSTGGVSFYEYLARRLKQSLIQPLIEQAKQEVAQRIFEEIENAGTPDYFTGAIQVTLKILLEEEQEDLHWWKELKSRYLGNKGGGE